MTRLARCICLLNHLMAPGGVEGVSLLLLCMHSLRMVTFLLLGVSG